VWFYRDLSAPDPYFILPILLGVSMVAQQKMTPQTSADPTQKQMMMIMPVMFTAFMLFSFSTNKREPAVPTSPLL
jgi:YidC/Oxa1 family membrane protein insertase